MWVLLDRLGILLFNDCVRKIKGKKERKMLRISACVVALMMTGLVSAAPISWLDSAVNAEYENTVKMRHYLHQHGELGNQEFETQKYIKSFLEKQGIKTPKKAVFYAKAFPGISWRDLLEEPQV